MPARRGERAGESGGGGVRARLCFRRGEEYRGGVAGPCARTAMRPGDTVAFHRPYKRLGVEKGDELRVAGVDRKSGTVKLEGAGGQAVAWEPNRIAARAGGVEVYRGVEIELRAGDRIRWTRNDAGLGLVNSGTAEVAAVRGGRVTFRLEDGRTLDLAPGDPQLHHLDRAWASTVHAFQGRTVDTVIAAMEANHPHLTTQKSFYVEHRHSSNSMRLPGWGVRWSTSASHAGGSRPSSLAVSMRVGVALVESLVSTVTGCRPPGARCPKPSPGTGCLRVAGQRR